MIANINYVKSVMGDLRAKKKYGQNFLIDSNIVDKIASIACSKDLKTIEIGPGLGSLSEMLLKYSDSVDAYEIDKDMYEILNNNINDDRFKVYLGDFLDTDLSVYKDKVNVCGNLPYYVTTPILFKIIESDLDINKLTIMVQKEVGDRIVAKVGSEDYSALSIEIQYLFDVKNEMNVSRNVFYPVPGVDSIVVSFIPKVKRNHEFEDKFFKLVKDSFRMRRKTLHNNLKDIYDEDVIKKVFDKLDIKDNIRAQEMSLDMFIKMYEVINEG